MGGRLSALHLLPVHHLGVVGSREVHHGGDKLPGGILGVELQPGSPHPVHSLHPHLLVLITHHGDNDVLRVSPVGIVLQHFLRSLVSCSRRTLSLRRKCCRTM